MHRDAPNALRTTLESRGDEMIALLASLVGTPSHATQPDGVNRVAEIAATELRAAGFSVDRRTVPPLADDTAWLQELMLPGYEYERTSPVLTATKRGGGATRGLLLGDLDTSFGPGAFTRFPFRIEGDRAFGPGIADMKGGLVVLTAALRALHDTGLADPAITTVILSPEEQAGSLKSRTVIEEAALSADWCLCVECARNGGALMGARAHIGVARIDVQGREAHAGSNHSAGINAIDALARKIPRINAVTDRERGVYVTVGQMRGGRRRSVVPGHADCTVDIRTPDAEAWTEIESLLAAITASKDVPGSSAQLRIHAHRPGIPWTEHTDRLIATARDAGRSAGIQFDVIRSPAAGSSAFVGGVPTLDGMGPIGGDLMTDREFIVVPSLVERALLLALTIHTLSI